MEPNGTDMLRHVEALFGDAPEGLIELAWTSRTGDQIRSAELFDVGDLEELVQHAAVINKTGCNVYIGAALRRPEALGVEAVGLLVYGAAAILGARRFPVLIGVGWLAHVAWDLAVPRPDPSYVWWWYPPLCLGFDLVIAFRSLKLASTVETKGRSR